MTCAGGVSVRGVGIDAERVGRFERLIGTAAGEALRAALFTSRERDVVGADPARWAALFTAKEAAAKTLGAGLFPDAGGLACHEMALANADGLAMDIHLSGSA